MPNNNISFTELDFITNKESLKRHLQGNELFKDYDFESSSMSLLLDILSYNTNKNAFYLNMVMSESFLDTAQLRSSIVSHAKELNYVPISFKSSKAKVKVSFEASGESQPYILPKGSPFSTINKAQAYTFCLGENLIVSSANNTFTFETEIYEGFYVKDSFVFQNKEEIQRFKLSNKQIDTDSISVVVYEDNSTVGEIYKVADTLLGLKSTSKIFFIQATHDDYYEILFGDGIFGKKPKVGATIVVDYRVTQGPAANGSKQFSMDFDPTNNSEMSAFDVETIEIAKSGSTKQSSELIRRYAPRYFATQQRGVSTDDYASLILSKFGSRISDVLVFGGEQLEPKQYGRVVVALKPISGDITPTFLKDEISAYLRNLNNVPTRVIIRDPNFLYAQVASTIQYNISITNKTPKEVESIALSTIDTFSKDNLEKFGQDFRYSKFVNAIDLADTSITSNDTELKLFKKIVPKKMTSYVDEINFNNAIVKEAEILNSTAFTYYDKDGKYWPFSYIQNTLDGKLIVYSFINNNKTIHNNNIGTIDYDKGIVKLSGLIVSDYTTNIKLIVETRTKDFIINKNSILIIEPEDVDITVIGTLE